MPPLVGCALVDLSYALLDPSDTLLDPSDTLLGPSDCQWVLLLPNFTLITIGRPLNSVLVQPLFAPPIFHINDARRTG